MTDFVECVAAESQHFRQAIEAIVAIGGDHALTTVEVPSCPGWTAADLTWHLAEVQYFWASIVEGNLAHPSAVDELVRPVDGELAALAGAQAARLVDQLARHAAWEPCWSWYPRGNTVGWVRRRQAHEALIHRIDAELALQAVAGSGRSAIDEELAADGVDEMLGVMLDVSERPEWARFEPDGRTVGIEVPGRSWLVRLGRLTGDDPEYGPQDSSALEMLDDGGGLEPDSVIRGPASEIDLWLWRREDLSMASIDGDRAAAERVREMANID